jgi:hypothetical protein
LGGSPTRPPIQFAVTPEPRSTVHEILCVVAYLIEFRRILLLTCAHVDPHGNRHRSAACVEVQPLDNQRCGDALVRCPTGNLLSERGCIQMQQWGRGRRLVASLLTQPRDTQTVEPHNSGYARMTDGKTYAPCNVVLRTVFVNHLIINAKCHQ